MSLQSEACGVGAGARTPSSSPSDCSFLPVTCSRGGSLLVKLRGA